MRHRKKTVKLGRTTEQREALMSGLVCGLIRDKRIVTTVVKAKVARRVADRMVTLGKRGTVASRARALSILRRKSAVNELFGTVAPAFADRKGGYTRVLKLSSRPGDNTAMAVLEWVNYIPPAPKAKKEKPEKAETAKK